MASFTFIIFGALVDPRPRFVPGQIIVGSVFEVVKSGLQGLQVQRILVHETGVVRPRAGTASPYDASAKPSFSVECDGLWACAIADVGKPLKMPNCSRPMETMWLVRVARVSLISAERRLCITCSSALP